MHSRTYRKENVNELKNLQKRKCESKVGNPYLFIHKNTNLLVEKMFIRSFFIILCNTYKAVTFNLQLTMTTCVLVLQELHFSPY